MTEWKMQMDDAIGQYQLVFSKEGDKYDRRMSCEMDKDLFKCHGIDKIELCAYCLNSRESFLIELRWEFKKLEDKYYFYPSAGEEFEKAIEEIKKDYQECKDKHNYLKNGDLTSVYKTCKGKRMESSHKACSLIMDMIFNMNRRGRSKKELDNFNALFCCTRIIIFRNFLLGAAKYMDSLSGEEKYLFLEEVTLFLEKVFSIRKCLDNNNELGGELKELEESSSITAILLRKKEATRSIGSGFVYEFDEKIKAAFDDAGKWKYTQKIENKESCRVIFHDMAASLFPGVVFENEDDVETVKNLLYSRKKTA